MNENTKTEYCNVLPAGSSFDAYRLLIEAGEILSPRVSAEISAARIMDAVRKRRESEPDL